MLVTVSSRLRVVPMADRTFAKRRHSSYDTSRFARTRRHVNAISGRTVAPTTMIAFRVAIPVLQQTSPCDICFVMQSAIMLAPHGHATLTFVCYVMLWWFARAVWMMSPMHRSHHGSCMISVCRLDISLYTWFHVHHAHCIGNPKPHPI